MIIQCKKCKMYLEDQYRRAICPHSAFPANDGNNCFRIHHEAYLSEDPPTTMPIDAQISGLKLYFVYYNSGSCNMGDHQCDLEQFDTLAEAEQRIKELRKTGYDDDIRLVPGDYVKMSIES